MTSGKTPNMRAVPEAPPTYGYGDVLSGAEVEAKKSDHGRDLIRHRILTQGKDNIYNLTGLVRAFPLGHEDIPALDSEFSFFAHFAGVAEDLVINHAGGNTRDHDAIICNRVTAGMLAIMLSVIKPGDRVLSLVQMGRSHPSVQQAVELAGGTFVEVQGIDAFESAIKNVPWQLVAITPLTPQKYHVPAADVTCAIGLAKDLDCLVVLDDAHMASRSVFYEEPAGLALGDVDATLWSLDKHVPGPRCGAVIAKRKFMPGIKTKAYQYGLEAQTGHYVAALRGVQAFDPNVIREAGHLARKLFERMRPKYGEALYQGGPGVAMSAQDFAGLVKSRAKDSETKLVPVEISTVASFIMLKDYGIVTIPVLGYPGAAPTFRLLMYPDGKSLGIDTIERSTEDAIEQTAGLLQRPGEVKRLLLGDV